ncbi:MAG: ABC transporter substrate-binding protein [Clostridiales Family XIII bacterium]|nr:ABC transporter substrate-binding protein [Clostridiales Family XIII bacterium]
MSNNNNMNKKSNRNRRRIAAVAVAMALLLAAALSACSPSAQGDGDSQGDSDRQGKAAETEGINIFVGDTIFSSSLDPVKGAMSYGYPFTNIALLKVSPDSEYIGDAATEWSVSDDALTYSFTLREGVKFSDGSELTAEDVVFTYETVKANQAENVDVDLTKLASANVGEGGTVVFTLSEPYSPFLDTAAMLGIVPKGSYDSDVFDRMPIGAGPWKVAQHDPNQQIIVEPNEYYYEGAPSIPRITFVNMETDAAIAAAKSGQLDVVMVDPNFAGEEIAGMHIEKLPTMDIRMISLPVVGKQSAKDADGNEVQVGNDVTADASVRRALSIGIDRGKIIEDAFNGIGKPAASFTAGLVWAAPEDVRDGRRDEAKSLLEDAGWTDPDGDGIREKGGVKCSFTVIATETSRYQLAAAVSEDAKELGIQIDVKNGTWDDVGKEQNQSGVVWGWGQYSPTVLKSIFYSKSFLSDEGYNVVGYANAGVDGLIDAALSAPSQDAAIANWKAVQETANADCPYLYLVNIEHCYFVSDRLDISLATQIPHPHGHGSPVICNMKDWSVK